MFPPGRRRMKTTGETEMKGFGKWAVAAAAGLGLLFTSSWPADATSAYAKAENKPCGFCHVGKAGDKVFTDAGKYYARHHSFAGFPEGGSAPKVPAKAAPAPASSPAAVPAAVAAPGAAAPAAAESAPMDKPMAEAGAPCPCCGAGCMERCAECPKHMHGKGDMPPMREKMIGHLEEMTKAVSDLRESEKRMESIQEPEAFRAAVLEHLKRLDDLHESHLNHMKKMLGGRSPGSGKEGQ